MNPCGARGQANTAGSEFQWPGVRQQATGRRQSHANESVDMSRFPRAPWFLAAMFLTAPVWAQMTGAGAQRSDEPAVYATRQRVFAIPFTVDRRVAQPVEVHLYVSEDRGASWQLYARQQPTARQFTFRAPRDGEYWFASRTLDANRPTTDQTKLQPELRVAVDTVVPQLQFTVRPTDDGAVMSSWRATDPQLENSSLRIEYQEGPGRPWKHVSVAEARDHGIPGATQGQTTWRPDSQSPTIHIRAVIRDRAGNQAVVNRRLLLPQLAAREPGPAGGRSSTPPDPFMRYRQPSEGAVSWPSDNEASSVATARDRSPAASMGMSPPSSAPRAFDRQNYPTTEFDRASAGDLTTSRSAAFGRSSTPASRSDVGQTPAIPVTDQRAMNPAGPALETPPDLSSPATAMEPAVGLPREKQAMDTLPDVRSEDPRAHRLKLPMGEQPRMTDATHFRLDYSVESVGASGVAEVQLWASGDGGETWQMWGVDEDLQSPFEVEVEEEGVYGFRVVIVSRSGLSGRPPVAGDPADIWVGVDTTKPEAELISATYGQGPQAGKMVLRWRAEDAFLGPRPISLLYSESADGPWSVIASSLPDSGEYAWPADPQLPRSVYLRLEVRDEAGNVAIHQLTEPVRLDGLAPKAKINGVLPVTDLDREAFRRPRDRR
jgi:hypothetical protein